MGFAASLIILLLLIFLIVVAIVFFKVGQGKIGLTSGPLTYSPFMRIFGRVYPIILLIALIAYYALPFEHLYRGNESTYIDPNLLQGRDRYWSNLTEEKLVALRDNGELGFETAELPFEQEQLILPTGFIGRFFVDQTPSADGTIVLQYYPGTLYLDGYQVDEFISLHAEDFMLLADGSNLDIKGKSPDIFTRRLLLFTRWSYPAMAGSLLGDDYLHRNQEGRFIQKRPILIIQVPEQATVVFRDRLVAKGEFAE